MSITGFCKTTYRNFMVDIVSWFSAHSTLTIRKFPGFVFCCFPSTTTCIPSPTSPSRMIGLSKIFRLPLSHTKVITKDFMAVVIRCRAYDLLTTPITYPYYLIGWSAMFIPAVMIAIKRTINSIKTTVGLKSISTSRAYLLNSSTFIFKSWHIPIIPDYVQKSRFIEIEEKYCEIAAKRMAQTVMELKI